MNSASNDKRGIAALILGMGKQENKPMTEEAEDVKGPSADAPEMGAKAHAAKKFFLSAQSGNWERAASALQNFLDICSYEESTDEEYE